MKSKALDGNEIGWTLIGHFFGHSHPHRKRLWTHWTLIPSIRPHTRARTHARAQESWDYTTEKVSKVSRTALRLVVSVQKVSNAVQKVSNARQEWWQS